ncbi:hypothetical protein HK104_005759, partial [Borealophlyctis nickersoniae]
MQITIYIDIDRDEDGFAYTARGIGYRVADKTTVSFLSVFESLGLLRLDVEKQVDYHFPGRCIR